MALDGKITSLTTIPAMDRTTDLLEIVDTSGDTSNKTTVNNMLGFTGGNPVSTSDTQTLTNKTLTSPTIASAVLSGTVTGTYTLAGTPTFPSSVVTLTGSQTLTNKILTSPTLTAPTLTNASITADAITGFTTANSGTIYGFSIVAGSPATNSIPATALATGIPASKFSNPYKFSVYRTAALTSTNATGGAAILFDTKTFDTGNNVDIVTNKGRFTVPVTGFYFFIGTVGNMVAGGGGEAFLRKNGVQVKAGVATIGDATVGRNTQVSGFLSLVAGDYVEVYYQGGAGSGIQVGADYCFFDGFLVSVT